jgi:hypothetical protein
MVEIPRIARGAIELRLGERHLAEFRHVGLAERTARSSAYTAPICATSRAGPSRSSRAVKDCPSVGGIAWTLPCSPRSNKSLVTSSTNSGTQRIQIDRVVPKLRDASQLVRHGFDCDCHLCLHHSVHCRPLGLVTKQICRQVEIGHPGTSGSYTGNDRLCRFCLPGERAARTARSASFSCATG